MVALQEYRVRKALHMWTCFGIKFADLCTLRQSTALGPSTKRSGPDILLPQELNQVAISVRFCSRLH